MGKDLVAATDGSSRGNPGPSGWGWYIDATQWQCGSLPKTTSIVAELTAIWRVLTAIPPTQPLLILTDSEFSVNVITKWAKGWERKGWTKSDGTGISNPVLVKAVWGLVKDRPAPVKLEWVKAHNGHPLNEAADTLATRASAEAERSGQRRVMGPGYLAPAGEPVRS